jgi:hypothetical protein
MSVLLRCISALAVHYSHLVTAVIAASDSDSGVKQNVLLCDEGLQRREETKAASSRDLLSGPCM